MVDQIVRDFVDMSLEIGLDAALIQGGGGNTSAKINDDCMIVKASGYRLKELAASSGFTAINFKSFREAVKNQIKSKEFDSESDFSKRMIGLQEDRYPFPKARPSMEAGFHALLGKFVIHSHSIYTNLIACSQEGPSHLQSFSKEINTVWIPYATPGKDLTYLIAQKIADSGFDCDSSEILLILESHGVIASAPTKESALALHQKANQIALNLFTEKSVAFSEIKEFEGNFFSSSQDVLSFFSENPFRFFEENTFFPDQAIFLSGKSDLIDFNMNQKRLQYRCNKNEAEAIDQTLQAIVYLYQAFKRHDLTPALLSLGNSETLLNLENEKYRKKIMQESKL